MESKYSLRSREVPKSVQKPTYVTNGIKRKKIQSPISVRRQPKSQQEKPRELKTRQTEQNWTITQPNKNQHPIKQQPRENQKGKRKKKLANSQEAKAVDVQLHDPEPLEKDDAAYETLKASEQRQLLPVYRARERVLEEIADRETVIIIGETGSGKTTQIPQLLYEAGFSGSGIIGVTQPRRVAAITLAMRVGDEMECDLIGDLIGYTVRFEDVTSPKTKIKFMTDGMLFREALLDSLLLRYSVIILDEAHERTVQTDVLFGLVKDAQNVRKAACLHPLKIVIMSATMDVDHFSNYFNEAPVLYITGRQFPVRVFNVVKSEKDYEDTCLITIFQIHREAPSTPGNDILVFLTGQQEIEAMVYAVKKIAQDLHGSEPALKVCPLYSSLPSHQQLDAFRPAPLGMRKVIISTNIAETSITIKGVRYVVDSGKVKMRTHLPGTGLDVLKVQQISQAQAWQRTGRAGRESSGVCYRAYTDEEFKSMPQNSVPEIQRCNLCSVVLCLLNLQINALDFHFMDQPPKQAIVSAMDTLLLLGAIRSLQRPRPHLTYLGLRMAIFPLDPKYSKIILSASEYSCLEEILSIIALLSGESVFVSSCSERDKALEARRKFESIAGDHITLLNVYRNYCLVREKKLWCQENYLHARNLEYARQVRNQLADVCKRLQIPFSSCGQNIEQVQRCLLTGLFMNIAEMCDKQYLTVVSKQVATIHPSSVLFNTRHQLVLYTEVVHTTHYFLKQVSIIEPDWLKDIVPDFFMKHQLAMQYT